MGQWATHPADLCTICAALKSTDTGLGYLFAADRNRPVFALDIEWMHHVPRYLPPQVALFHGLSYSGIHILQLRKFKNQGIKVSCHIYGAPAMSLT